MKFSKFSIKLFAKLIIFNILFFQNAISENIDIAIDFPYFCDLKISYFPGSDGNGYEVYHQSQSNEIKAKTLIYEGEHPVHGSFTQLGVRILGIVCYKNESTQIIFVDDPDNKWIKLSDEKVQQHEYSLKDFILIFLDDNKTDQENQECSNKWWTSFAENKNVILKIADIWQGTTTHYSTDYAIVPHDIMINASWICS